MREPRPEPQHNRDEHQTNKSSGYEQPNNRRSQGVWSQRCGIPRPLALSTVRTESHGRKGTVTRPGRREQSAQGGWAVDSALTRSPGRQSPPDILSHSVEAPALSSQLQVLPTEVAGAPAPTGRHSPEGEEERDADQR